jgi:hypothetical protein
MDREMFRVPGTKVQINILNILDILNKYITLNLEIGLTQPSNTKNEGL